MSSMPVDTVRGRFVDVDPAALHVAEWDRYAKVHGKLQWIEYGEPYRDLWPRENAHFRFVFRAADQYFPEIRNSLMIEFNPTKVAYSCNHCMIQDWESVLDEVNEILRSQPGMDCLDIRDIVLFRLDIAANLQLGEDAAQYLAALWKARYPRREMIPFIDEDGRTTGIMFKNKKGKIALVFYLKYLECLHQEAEGILHMELRLLKKPFITDKLGKDLTLGALQAGKLFDLLEKEMKVLRLDHEVVSDRLELEERLGRVYSSRQTRGLLGYVLQNQSLGYEGMIRQGTGRDSIWRFNQLLKDAGITCLSLDCQKTLPPLFPVLQAIRNSGGC